MAKSIIEEDLRLNIVVNGDNGRKELYEAQEAVKRLNESLEEEKKVLQQVEREWGKTGVVTMSKIGKMKAIHNRRLVLQGARDGVVTMSKIGKMKAIHNKSVTGRTVNEGVVTMTKLSKKAQFRTYCIFPFARRPAPAPAK